MKNQVTVEDFLSIHFVGLVRLEEWDESVGKLLNAIEFYNADNAKEYFNYYVKYIDKENEKWIVRVWHGAKHRKEVA